MNVESYDVKRALTKFHVEWKIESKPSVNILICIINKSCMFQILSASVSAITVLYSLKLINNNL